jgi:hypothetical protein
VVPEAQRRCKHAELTHIVAGPVDARQRHPDDLSGSTIAAKTKQVFAKRSFRGSDIPRNAALLIGQNLPAQLRLTIKRSCICGYESPRARSKSTIFYCLWLYALCTGDALESTWTFGLAPRSRSKVAISLNPMAAAFHNG